jgi:hypothetical protein
MDDKLIDAMRAELGALRIMVAALAESFSDQTLLRKSIQQHALLFGSALPQDTEEQRQHFASIKSVLNTYYPLVRE